jgi:cobalt-zinc-cadmium efflux system outer membrane protein
VAALADLRVLLGLPPEEPLSIRGDLRERPGLPERDLRARARSRPDVLALEAELREHQGERAVGTAQRVPSLGVGGVYERHEGAHIGLAMVSVSLPSFQRGQATIARADANIRRVDGLSAAARNIAATEVEAALAVYAHRVAAVEVLEREALPLLEENESQLQRGYEAGHIPLIQVLAARREIVDTRLSYLNRLLEAANASVEVLASANLLSASEDSALPAALPTPRPRRSP